MLSNKSLNTPLFPTAQVINSTGVNSAYLQSGESCVSLPHNFCALIVITNGKESFVTHQARPNLEMLMPELTKIRSVLPGPLTVKIYQDAIDNPKAKKMDRQDISALLSGLGMSYLGCKLEPHRNIEGAYLITANGEVSSIGLPEGFETPPSPAYQQAVEDYHQDFMKSHVSQPVLAHNHLQPGQDNALLRYAHLPAFATDGRAERAGIRFDTGENLCGYSKSWNSLAEAIYRQQMLEKPTIPATVPATQVTGNRSTDNKILQKPSGPGRNKTS